MKTFKTGNEQSRKEKAAKKYNFTARERIQGEETAPLGTLGIGKGGGILSVNKGGRREGVGCGVMSKGGKVWEKWKTGCKQWVKEKEHRDESNRGF